jgi:hypothetical protein
MLLVSSALRRSPMTTPADCDASPASVAARSAERACSTTAEGALLGVAAGRSAVLDHLFGDRLAATDLLRTGGPRSVFANVPVYVDLLALADRIGVNIVDGDEDHEFMDSLR